MSKATLLSNNPDEDIAPVSPFGNVDYGVTEDSLKALAESFSDIKEVPDRKSYDAAQKAVTTLKRARTNIETRRKELKSDALEFGRLVDSTAKDLTAVIQPEEQRIQDLLDVVKAQKAAEKAERERIEQERIDRILARIDAIVKVPASLQRADSAKVLEARDAMEKEVIDDTFEEFVERAAEAKANTIEELNELYAGALHDERIAEQERKERERIEAEQKAEAERLAAERAALDAERKAQEEAERKRHAEAEAKIAAERAEIERQQSELRAEQERMEKAKRDEEERQRQEAEAKERAEREAEEKAEAKARAERLKPDYEKVEALVSTLEQLVMPELSDEPESSAALEKLYEIIQSAASQVQVVAASLR